MPREVRDIDFDEAWDAHGVYEREGYYGLSLLYEDVRDSPMLGPIWRHKYLTRSLILNWL